MLPFSPARFGNLAAMGAAALSLRDQVLAAVAPELMFDGFDGSTLYQGRTGSGAGAAFGDPAGSQANLGVLGGYRYAPSDSQRPVRRAGGLECDGVDDGYQFSNLTLTTTMFWGLAADVTTPGMLVEHSVNGFTTGNGFFVYGTVNGPWVTTRGGTSAGPDGSVGTNWSVGDHVLELQLVAGAAGADVPYRKDGVDQSNGGSPFGAVAPLQDVTDTLNMMFRNGGSIATAGLNKREILCNAKNLSGANLALVRAWLAGG